MQVTRKPRIGEREVDAAFILEGNGSAYTVTIHSRSGNHGQNPEYVLGFDTVLNRLSDIGAVLVQVLLASKKGLQYPEEERIIKLDGISLPLRVNDSTDLVALRKKICRGAANTLRETDAKGSGNNTKRVELRVALDREYSLPELEALLVLGSKPKVWIFQGNPDRFQMNAYLEARMAGNRNFLWVSRQHTDKISPGDRVYMWRARGSGRDDSGIVAQATCLSHPTMQLDDEPQLWLGEDLPIIEPRVLLFLNDLRLFENEGMLTASHLRKIPELANLPIFKLASQTNYLLNDHHSTSLDELWGGDPKETRTESRERAYAEGNPKLMIHLRRERSQKVVREAKALFIQRHGRLFCEACKFDFASQYGQLGEGFIEAHHLLPLGNLEAGTETKPSDLAMLCANCHRMIHYSKEWLSVDALRDLLQSPNA